VFARGKSEVLADSKKRGLCPKRKKIDLGWNTIAPRGNDLGGGKEEGVILNSFIQIRRREGTSGIKKAPTNTWGVSPIPNGVDISRRSRGKRYPGKERTPGENGADLEVGRGGNRRH